MCACLIAGSSHLFSHIIATLLRLVIHAQTTPSTPNYAATTLGDQAKALIIRLHRCLKEAEPTWEVAQSAVARLETLFETLPDERWAVDLKIQLQLDGPGSKPHVWFVICTHEQRPL